MFWNSKHAAPVCLNSTYYWDRGRPARNEREARTISLGEPPQKRLRVCGALRAGRPRSQ